MQREEKGRKGTGRNQKEQDEMTGEGGRFVGKNEWRREGAEGMEGEF
jgi:hypothetical protein